MIQRHSSSEYDLGSQEQNALRAAPTTHQINATGHAFEGTDLRAQFY
jgi:hypothetical protein